ncbi:hypothetical protein PYCCODRAFT_1029030 [Trametes coccinea BRFM310]|uniref:Uncharacterized protein n=1 Tax=Trametes coccinea (strain BRFM310) TaxID=1353009 RepID=A0A1Y2IAV2_TRAC3|nr:hypothetical protein PYCCODRAFT_1029030 [Trametes coccinea BRFM310]
MHYARTATSHKGYALTVGQKRRAWTARGAGDAASRLQNTAVAEVVKRRRTGGKGSTPRGWWQRCASHPPFIRGPHAHLPAQIAPHGPSSSTDASFKPGPGRYERVCTDMYAARLRPPQKAEARIRFTARSARFDVADGSLRLCIAIPGRVRVARERAFGCAAPARRLSDPWCTELGRRSSVPPYAVTAVQRPRVQSRKSDAH